MGAVCQPHEKAIMVGNWTNRYRNAQRRPSSRKDYVECLVECKGNYPLGCSSKWCNITANLYCQQLDHIAAKFQRKQDRVYFFHANARVHVAKSILEKLLKLEWIMILHPPYSPDLAPTDYHLYCSLSGYLREKNSTMKTTSNWI